MAAANRPPVSRIVLPGYSGSGAQHWQTLWQAEDPAMRRFQPSSWDHPDRDDWVAALDRVVAEAAGPVVLIAHSLSCLLVAHWAGLPGRRAAGAFLVAPPDPDGPAFPRAEAKGFDQAPDAPLGFPTLVVASSDDPYASLDWQRARAALWGAGLVEIGPRGHINGQSGLGGWTEGRNLLTAFETGLGLQS